MEIIIDPEDIARVIGADILRMEVHLREQVTLEVAHHAEARAVRGTNDKGAVHLGAFKLGWHVMSTAEGAALVNDVPYAGVIELGRRPGRPGPPFAPILEWVRRKLVPNGKIVPREGETMEEAARSAAFAIRKTIHEKGTKPRYILRDVNDELPGMVAAALRRTFRRRLLTGS